MNFLLKFITKKIARFRSLETAVRGLKKDVSIPSDAALVMRNRLLRSIKVAQPRLGINCLASPRLGLEEGKRHYIEEAGFASLITKIKILASEVVPAPAFKAFVREKLIALAGLDSPIFSRWPFWVRQHKKLWAGAIAFLFLFTTLFNFTFNIERVEASFSTVLESASGDVVVFRGNEAIPAVPGLLLRKDDIVKTGSASKAIIRFLDQSVSRLDENTEVKIIKLFVNPLNKTETVVELVLSRGRIWARVVNLIDNVSNFKVKAKHTVAVAKKKAAFDVSVSAEGQATVSAIKNKVDLVVATENQIIETTLVKGYTAEMQSDILAVPQIHSEKTGTENSQWVTDNLAQDDVYIETVKREAENTLNDQVKMLPGNPLYAVKQLSEGTKLAFTLDDFDKQNKILSLSQEKFAEAQALLAKGDIEGGKASLADFQSQLKGVLAWALEAEAINPEQALNLKNQVMAILNEYQKKLSLMMPTDPLYSLKDSVAQILINIKDDPQEKTEQMLSTAGDKLLEAHDLVEQGDAVKAKEQIEAYGKAISDVVSEVKQMPSDAKEKAVATFLDNKIEDSKTLDSIQETVRTAIVGTSTEDVVLLQPVEIGTSTADITGTTTPEQLEPQDPAIELQRSITEVKQDALIKLGEAVSDVQKEQPSNDVSTPRTADSKTPVLPPVRQQKPR